MIILPAIDLYDNKVVRLYKGDYNQMTIYSDDAVAKAGEIEAAGASWLHIVDLAGAKDGSIPAFDTVAGICAKTNLNIEIGGGIRELSTIQRYVEAGVKRTILGTKAIEDEEFLREAVKEFGDVIAVGCDAKDGYLATHGWLKDSGIEITEYVKKLIDIGVSTVISTDISRDGAMRGTNLSLYETLDAIGDIDVIASGGVSSYEDIEALDKLDIYGAIVGKAMYEGTVDIAEAIKRTKDGR